CGHMGLFMYPRSRSCSDARLFVVWLDSEWVARINRGVVFSRLSRAVPGRILLLEEHRMRVRSGISLAVVIGLSMAVARAEEIKSGPDKKIGGAFQVKAITGDNTGKQLCYV